MIGVVVVTHGEIGKEMVTATQRIIPEAENLVGVAIESNAPTSLLRDQVQEAIREVEDSDGVLILTDMFGGTPSNICLSFLTQANIEVISGVNLPMLIKLASMRHGKSFSDIVSFIQQYGQRNIVVASSVLEGNIEA